jgi:hypothetical protein
MRALTSLDLSNNSLGQPSDLPEGWSEPNPGNPDYRFEHTDGRHQAAPPEGSKFEAIIALADAIKDMGAMTSLNLSRNDIGGHYDDNDDFVSTPEGTYLSSLNALLY